MYLRQKISTKNIEKFLSYHSTTERVLVIHSEDVDTTSFFPNAYTVTKRPDVPADMHVDLFYDQLSEIESGSYDQIVCTGLLEHVPEPATLIAQLHRILREKGKLVLQASCVFSIHEAPNNYFQFLHYGMEHMFRDWGSADVTGSCQPYETISILLQRITLQTESNFFTKVITVILYNLLPLLDRTLTSQFGSVQKTPETKIDSMLPSNIQVVAVK